jgi:hypothetical protein
MIPMLGFMAAMGLWAERYIKRSPQIISISLAAMVSALTELTLICSFPVKSRRNHAETVATAPTEPNSNEMDRRDTSPKLTSRPSNTSVPF